MHNKRNIGKYIGKRGSGISFTKKIFWRKKFSLTNNLKHLISEQAWTYGFKEIERYYRNKNQVIENEKFFLCIGQISSHPPYVSGLAISILWSVKAFYHRIFHLELFLISRVFPPFCPSLDYYLPTEQILNLLSLPILLMPLANYIKILKVIHAHSLALLDIHRSE